MELYFLHIRLDMWFDPIFTQTIRPLQIFIFSPQTYTAAEYY